ncbi:MAG: hypothetical protein LBK54_10300 [Propionibacteriaceae bacterium]|jgi:hypothetical protein|nr:hypothetical protein [Propionibacteriaceae bacterium]
MTDEDVYGDPFDRVDDGLALVDFDREQDEDAELHRIADQVKPRFLLVERSLAALFPDGQRVKAALDIPYETVMEAIEASDSQSQTEQLEAVFKLIHDDTALRVLKSQSFVAFQMFAAKFFDLWGKLAGYAMGESRSSANSS